MADTSPHLIGYARVSTDDQRLDLQLAALTNAGVPPDNIYTDTASGQSIAKRHGLRAAFKDLRDGDVLVIWKLDRLGRNLAELIQTVQLIRGKGAHLRCLTQAIDTTTPAGIFVFHIFGAMAEFERALIVERTNAGLAIARAQGRKGGRRPVFTAKKQQEVMTLLSEGKSVAVVAKEAKVSRSTIHKWRALVQPDAVTDDLEEETEE